jgi:predicted nucleic acid-binding protein
MKKTLIDSSFFIALINPREMAHEACVEIALDKGLHKVVVTSTIPETCYMLHRWLGHSVMRTFVKNLQNPQWQIEQIQIQDLARASDLLHQYADLRLDLVDASLVAIAERLNIDTILSLDQRDFRVIRPLHTDHFTILP